MTLREMRQQRGLTQNECAAYLGIPKRTYQNYESDARKVHSMKYIYMMQKLERYGYVDEETGILTIDEIKTICQVVFSAYDVNYCYLFGSYAKGRATEKSDVDLLVSTSVTGIRFYDMAESLRESLKKKVDLLDQRQLQDNFTLTEEILKDGIKIYG